MPNLSEMIGFASPSGNGNNATSLAELAAIKKEIAAAKERLKTLEDNPSIDLTPIEEEIAKLEQNEALDDESLAALKGLVEKIKIPDIEPLKTELTTVKATVSTHNEDITTLKSQRADLKASVDNMDNAMGALDLKVNAIKIPDVSGLAAKTALAEVDSAYKAADLVLDGKKVDKSSLGSETIDYYRGSFADQAGDTGHIFTTIKFNGSNIKTSNNKIFTLSKGIYEVDFFASKHYGANVWRNTALLVDNNQVANCYSGSDGSNWEGSGSITEIVDATVVDKTVQIKRVGSTGNGNLAGYLTIRRLPATNVISLASGTQVIATNDFDALITRLLTAASQRSYSFAAFRNDDRVISIGTGSPSWTNIRFANNGPSYKSADLLHSSGDVIVPQTGRILVENKWWNSGSGDQRIALQHKNLAGVTIRNYENVLNTDSRTGYSAVVINATEGDRLNWVGSGSGATSIWWGQDHTELRISSFL